MTPQYGTPQYLVLGIQGDYVLATPRGDDANICDSQGSVEDLGGLTPSPVSILVKEGAIIRHRRLLNVRPSLVLARPQNANVNILGQRMPALFSSPKHRPSKEKKSKKV